VPQKLGRLAVAHLLERKELCGCVALLRGQPPHQVGPQRVVGSRSGGEVMISSASAAYRWSARY
jgi:hypothetical protein